MNGATQQVQFARNIKQVNRRLDRIEMEMSIIIAALKKKKPSTLDLGLKDLSIGRVHKYRDVKSLAKDVWG